MKRTFHSKALPLLISGLLVCLLVCWAQAQAKKKPTPTPTPEKKIRMEDAIERREGESKIVFKPQFEVVKRSNNSAVVSKKSTGTNSETRRVEVGEIQCNCTPIPGGGGGGCEFKVDFTTVTCRAFGGCKCKLELVTKLTQ